MTNSNLTSAQINAKLDVLGNVITSKESLVKALAKKTLIKNHKVLRSDFSHKIAGIQIDCIKDTAQAVKTLSAFKAKFIADELAKQDKRFVNVLAKADGQDIPNMVEEYKNRLKAEITVKIEELEKTFLQSVPAIMKETKAGKLIDA